MRIGRIISYLLASWWNPHLIESNGNQIGKSSSSYVVCGGILLVFIISIMAVLQINGSLHQTNTETMGRDSSHYGIKTYEHNQSSHHFAWSTNTSVYFVGAAKGSNSKLGEYVPIRRNIRTLSNYWPKSQYSVVIYADPVAEKYLSEWKEDMNTHIITERTTDVVDDKSRTARISHGRNMLVKEVFELSRSRKEDPRNVYLIALDFDDVNAPPFKTTVFEYVMNHQSLWDAVSFNRDDYYDTWALRYARFNFNLWNFETSVKQKSPFTLQLSTIMQKDIKRQLQKHEFYPVLSAFNGFAVYKLEFTKSCMYNGLNQEESEERVMQKVLRRRKGLKSIDPINVEDCEHVSFHKCMIDKNKARIMIYNGTLV